jgi:hypothetical protein
VAAGQGSIQSYSNWLTFPYSLGGLQNPNAVVSGMGRGITVRSEYMLGPMNNGYPEAPYAFPTTAPVVNNPGGRLNYGNMTTTGFTPSIPYSITYPNQFPGLNGLTAQNVAPCGISGYTKPYTA